MYDIYIAPCNDAWWVFIVLHTCECVEPFLNYNYITTIPQCISTCIHKQISNDTSNCIKLIPHILAVKWVILTHIYKTILANIYYRAFQAPKSRREYKSMRTYSLRETVGKANIRKPTFMNFKTN